MSTATAPLPPALADAVRGDAALRRFLRGLPGVDAAGLDARAAHLAGRSVEGESRRRAVDLAISMIDLTTLEGTDTPASVRALCATARRQGRGALRVAAVCVYPDLVATAADALAGSGIPVASVATAFPAGRAALPVKIADVRHAVAAGAAEVDMVIDRGAFLAGRYGAVLAEIAEVKRVCGDAHLKVILETGELAGYDDVRRAAWLALLAGADFLKTSTGKVSPAATLPAAHLLLQAVRDWHGITGRHCGVKAAGGIRSAADAVRYLVAVREVAGAAWLTPRRFRFGASSLLGALLAEPAAG